MGGAGLFWLVFLVLPSIVGVIVALTKPPEFVAWINNASAGCDRHYVSVSSRDGFFAGLWSWVIWGIHKLHQWTEAIEDEANRAGTRFALFFCVASLSLIIIASLIYVALVIAAIIFGIWVIAKVLDDGSGSQGGRDWDEEERERVRTAPMAARKGRSRPRKDMWGNSYTEHLDEEGEPIGRSEFKKDWLGNTYVETTNASGEVVETSRHQKDWLGEDYVEHRNSDGDKSGESRAQKDWLGADYTEHRDVDGVERSRSRKRSDWLGAEYTEHEPKE